MQRKTNDNETRKIYPCSACGMMSFPSQGCVFAAKEKEKEKPVVIQSAPSSNTLNQSDSDSDSDDLGNVRGCAACGMMSFPAPTANSKC